MLRSDAPPCSRLHLVGSCTPSRYSSRWLGSRHSASRRHRRNQFLVHWAPNLNRTACSNGWALARTSDAGARRAVPPEWRRAVSARGDCACDDAECARLRANAAAGTVRWPPLWSGAALPCWCRNGWDRAEPAEDIRRIRAAAMTRIIRARAAPPRTRLPPR